MKDRARDGAVIKRFHVVKILAEERRDAPAVNGVLTAEMRKLMGEHGGATWDDTQIFLDQGGYMMNSKPGYVPQRDAFEYKMRHFVEVCRGTRENESPGEHGLLVQKMLDGVYQSSETGREVTIE